MWLVRDSQMCDWLDGLWLVLRLRHRTVLLSNFLTVRDANTRCRFANHELVIDTRMLTMRYFSSSGIYFDIMLLFSWRGT